MDRKLVERMRLRLLSEREELLQQIGLDRNEYHLLVDSSRTGDLADGASLEVDSEILARLEIQEREHLRLLSSALLRIEQGRYGICESCGGEIPAQRLEAAPDALLCVECRRRFEQGKR